MITLALPVNVLLDLPSECASLVTDIILVSQRLCCRTRIYQMCCRKPMWFMSIPCSQITTPYKRHHRRLQSTPTYYYQQWQLIPDIAIISYLRVNYICVHYSIIHCLSLYQSPQVCIGKTSSSSSSSSSSAAAAAATESS